MTEISDKNFKKLADLGGMTRGILHDLNGSLAAIMGFASFLSEDLDPKSEQHVFAENIKKAGHQIEELVDQVRALSMERGTNKDTSINIVDTISQIANSYKNNLPDNQKILFHEEIKEAYITMPLFQFKIMIGNIIKNAVQSLDSDEGTIMIHISEKDWSKKSDIKGKYHFFKNIFLNIQDSKKSYLQIDFIDSGCGMDDVTLNLAPSPHFTTKSADIAHGLGLSISSRIVDNLCGDISIATTPKIGTKITMVLPAEKIII
jgi:signal transduction histidine kinase